MGSTALDVRVAGREAGIEGGDASTSTGGTGTGGGGAGGCDGRGEEEGEEGGGRVPRALLCNSEMATDRRSVATAGSVVTQAASATAVVAAHGYQTPSSKKRRRSGKTFDDECRMHKARKRAIAPRVEHHLFPSVKGTSVKLPI